jgi:acetyl-CoA acyltransferase
MRDAVIVEAVRTPVGKRNGGLSSVHPVELSAHVLNVLQRRSGVDPVTVDDVYWGCVHQVMEQTYNVARNAVIAAGWPESIPGTTIDRQCGSSQQTVSFATASIRSGMENIVIAGGVENMSRVPMGASILEANPFSEPFGARYGGAFPNMGLGAETIAARWGFSRTQIDEFSIRSHERASAARSAGKFDAEIAPVTLADGTVISADEGIRPGGTVESLAALKTPFKSDGLISAAASSQISDGAAGLLMMGNDVAAELGLQPIARVHTAVVVGDDPIVSLLGMIPATRKVLQKSGLSLSDIGVFEVSEAFASVTMAWQAEINVNEDLLNPNGGAISLGHPLGASGARIMTTMVHHMKREGIRYGLQTMCEGGGMSNATILELV